MDSITLHSQPLSPSPTALGSPFHPSPLPASLKCIFNTAIVTHINFLLRLMLSHIFPPLIQSFHIIALIAQRQISHIRSKHLCSHSVVTCVFYKRLSLEYTIVYLLLIRTTGNVVQMLLLTYLL
jgi:hypothetical protein